jgi:O-antigen/teichoic acid export membrane protein
MNGHSGAVTAPGGRSFRERVLRAGGWTLAGYAWTQGVRFATNLIMTRLLVPEMFGIMTAAMMVMFGLALFADLGLRHSVVQNRRGLESAFLDTVWLLKIGLTFLIGLAAALIGFALGVAAAEGAFAADSAFAAPELPIVLAALGLSTLVSGFESTKIMEASRHLALGRLTRLQILAQAAGVATMLVFALFERSIWVLVAGHAASTLAATVLSHVSLPGTRNRFAWDETCAREILRFGRWIIVSSTTGFVASAWDKLILGGVASASVLGVYSIAGLLLSAVEQVLGKLMGEVTFPALSEVARDRGHDLSRTFYKFYVPMAGLAYFIAGFLALAGGVIVRVLYDARYVDAGWMLQILALSILALPARIHAQRFLALGHSRWQSNLAAVRLAVVVVLVPVGLYAFDIAGAIWAVVISHLATIPFALWYASRGATLSIGRELLVAGALIPGVLLGVAVARLVPA